MEMETHVKKFADQFLARISGSRAKRGPLTRAEVSHLLSPDYSLETADTHSALRDLEKSGLLKVGSSDSDFLKISDLQAVGAMRLIRAFCARYYGEVSPCVDRKMIQAVLNRHGANYDLDSEEVQGCLKELESQGLIRLVGKDHFYLKMLG